MALLGAVQLLLFAFVLFTGSPGATSRLDPGPSRPGGYGPAAAADNPNPPAAPVKLIFIHHSTGENWLGDSNGRLGLTLRDNNYFVSDTNYEWGPPDADAGSGTIGDHTDIGNWYSWFSGPNRDAYTTALYSEYGQHSDYTRLATDPGGPNRIVMFKSCFPNSNFRGSPGDPVPAISDNPLRGQDSGSDEHTISNAKGIYIELLKYFASRQDRLFVAVTAPPLARGETDAATATNARAFNHWLVNEWLKGYAYSNVFVFDFYNILTSNGGPSRTDNPSLNDFGAPDGNHHRWYGNAIQHLQTINNNFAAYPSSTNDSHPTAAGGTKASGEFAALLNVAYHRWQAGAAGCAVSCAASVPGSASTNQGLSFAATATPSGCTGPTNYDWDFGDGSPHSPQQSANHSYAGPGNFTWTITASVAGTTCSKTGTVGIFAPSGSCPQLPSVTDRSVYQVPALTEPLPHVRFQDPVFKTCVVRVTDRTKDMAPGDSSAGMKNEYSRVQAFNADESRILVRGLAATWYLYDARTLERKGKLPFEGAVDPRWDASDPNAIYFSEGTRLMKCDIRSGELTVVHDFQPDFPGVPLSTVWMRYEGSPSLDGRYWGFMTQDSESHVGYFLIYDQQANAVTARRDMRTFAAVDGVDSVTISPLGSYFVAQFDSCPSGTLGTDASPCGLMVYDRELKNGRGLHRIIGHSDLALDAQNREVMVYQDNDTDDIGTIDLGSGSVTRLLPIDFSHGAIGFHFSGRAYLLPGWAVVSAHVSSRTSYTWMDDQVFAVELKASGRVVRLAHTHSLVDANMEQDYWAEPHASTNRDMTKILFTTNWGRSGTEQVDMYQIELPSGWASDKAPAAALIFPRLVTNPEPGTGVDRSEYTGFGFANAGSANGVLTLSAFDSSGSLISGPGITNPRSIGLNAGRQLAVLDYQVFGDGLMAKKPTAWIALTSTIRQIVGFFLMFNGSLTTLDGADASAATATSFVLPEIEDLGTTQIHVVNPNGEPAAATFELRAADGRLKGAAALRNVTARGAVAEFVASLFPGASISASDYVRVTSNKPLAGFESLGRAGQYTEGVNGQSSAAGATTLYSAQYVVGPSWRSTLSIVNLEDTGGTVTLRWIRDDGTQIGDTRREAIGGLGKIYVADQRYFSATSGIQSEGYVEIVSSGPKLAGSVVFGDPGRSQFAAALPLKPAARSSMIFSQVASDSTYFTGLALLNPGNSGAAVSIEVLDAGGNRLASKTESLQAGQRKSLLLTQYFPALAAVKVSSGTIRITSDRNVAGFALFGAPGVLAAIPPQEVP